MSACEVDEFLHVMTPISWVACATENQSILLIDHANCERKAASSALAMIYRYGDRVDFVIPLSKIVREEMRHFEQVRALMMEVHIKYEHLSISKYARTLHLFTREQSPSTTRLKPHSSPAHVRRVRKDTRRHTANSRGDYDKAPRRERKLGLDGGLHSSKTSEKGLKRLESVQLLC